MNSRIFGLSAALGACLLLAACATRYDNPTTFQVAVGAPYLTSAYGPVNLSVNAVQDVPCDAGERFYFQVVAPTTMQVMVYDPYGMGTILSQFSGTSFNSVVMPNGDHLEFIFSAIQPATLPTAVQLTVCENPLGPIENLNSPVATTTYTTTTTQAPMLMAQPPVAISPIAVTTNLGQPVTLSVSGGAGTGGFVWGGAANAAGWSNQYTFNAPGTYTITAYRSGDASYTQSNLASATVTVAAPMAPPPAYSNPAVIVTPIR